MALDDYDLCDPDASLLLTHCEKMNDGGFALPLFQMTPGSNIWYTAETERLSELTGKITGFRAHHPCIDAISPIQSPHRYRIDDKTPIIFLHNNDQYIGDESSIFNAVKSIDRIAEFYPITMFDIALYSNNDVQHYGSNCYKKLKIEHGSEVAEKWHADIACKQALMIDVKRMYTRMIKSNNSDANRFISIMENAYTRQTYSDTIALIVSYDLFSFLDIDSNRINNDFPMLTKVASMIGLNIEFRDILSYNNIGTFVKFYSNEDIIGRDFVLRIPDWVSISGKGVSVDNDLQQFTLKRLTNTGIELSSAHIVYSRNRIVYNCSINVNSKYGILTTKSEDFTAERSCMRGFERIKKMYSKAANKKRYYRYDV